MKASINDRLANSLFRLTRGVDRLPRPTQGTDQPPTAGLRRGTKLTLAWADHAQRQRIMELATSEGRQTMNLRTMPGAKLAVLTLPDGRFAGWTGMDAETHPERPEVFSQFVYPPYRGLGLGALLEHVWWAYLSAWGCNTAYMRMEFDSNQRLFEHRLASGYCREATAAELGERFVSACRGCELYGRHCTTQAFLAVNVERALAESVERRGPLDICQLPLKFRIAPPHKAGNGGQRTAAAR